MTGHKSVHPHPSMPSSWLPNHPTDIRPAELWLLTTGLGFLLMAAIFSLDAEVATQKAVDVVRILAGTIPILWHW